MTDWIRPLFWRSGGSGEWHLRAKIASTTTSCGRDLAGPIEVTSEDKAEREERCKKCAPRVTAPKKPAAKPKKATKPAASKRSTKPPVAKRAARGSRRGRR